MQATLVHNSATRKTLEILFPAPLVDSAFKVALAKITPKVKLPGFRPGKAPKNVLVSRFKSEIAREVAENLMDSHFEEAIRSIGVHPISRPAIESAKLGEGAEGLVKIQFDVAPEVKLPEYKGLNLVKKKRVVDDEYVNSSLELMRERAARYIPVEDGAEFGHFVMIDMRVKPKGMKAKVYEDKSLQLDESRPFDAKLTGLKVDETKSFTLHVPEDDKDRSVAGREAYYEVHVLDIRSKVVPDLDDEFAKDVGNYENLQALREGLRKDLENAAESDALARLQSDILDMLLDASTFEAPYSMVSLQLDDYCREFIDRLDNIGVSHKNVDWKMFRQRRLNDAERAVRSGYLLQTLGNVEGIQVSDDEIDDEIRKWMEETKAAESFEAIKSNFEKHGATTEIRGRVRTEKIFDMLLKNATVTEEILDGKAYDDLIEMERRRKEGLAQARFDAGGLGGGDFEEQEGGDPDAIVPAESDDEKEPNLEDAPSQGDSSGVVPIEESLAAPEKEETPAAPAKRGRPKKSDPAPAPEEAAEVEEAAPPKRGRAKKSDAGETAAEAEEAAPAKRGRPRKADAEEAAGQEDAEKPKRGRKKLETES